MGYLASIGESSAPVTFVIYPKPDSECNVEDKGKSGMALCRDGQGLLSVEGQEETEDPDLEEEA